MNARIAATEAQVQAAHPGRSTWLSANAGSGKTRVLTDRVARLLLSGVEPQHILCLTYTKAAASEMQNRLFQRLGAWAMLDDDALRAALAELGDGDGLDAARLRKARTLFASAIETPGGLKIQTIHSFCSALLRRFPLEARVSPQFAEIEDRAADLLRGEIVDAMADSPDAPLVEALARHASGDDLAALTREIVHRRETFAQPLGQAEALRLMGAHPATGPLASAARVLDASVAEWLPDACAILARQSATMVEMAEALATLDLERPGEAELATLKSLFLYRNKDKYRAEAKTGSVPTKKAREALGEYLPSFHGLMERTAEAHEQHLAEEAAERTAALHAFAARFLARYEAAKAERGWLDFDDLIDRARLLLGDPGVAAWVLFRIDGGIDHILVDEAQDTSPAQWDVIEKLAAEFTAGHGAHEGERTIFVVGDKKQSIYSFQGADAAAFDRMRTAFGTRLEAVGKRLERHVLKYSFRSASAILDTVDRTFDGRDDAGFGDDARHAAFRTRLPGRVDLWPWVETEAKQADQPWYLPVDIEHPNHHTVVLAERVAAQIEWMLDPANGQTIPDEVEKRPIRRPLRPGDFLILVRTRNRLFGEIIRACKTRGLEIAGTDKLKVAEELAVRDIAALLTFLAVPDDCLSLASALRSPLFGWSDKRLFDLAHPRGDRTLWQALRGKRSDYPEEMRVLDDLRGKVEFLRPFELIERILTRHEGRRKLLARLGHEAEDGINALLSQALAYERSAVPSLTGFLAWMESDDLEIKRQIDSASNRIRVMTIHGAKGLEAPVVILPDCGQHDFKIRDDILEIDATPVWKTPAEEMPGPMAAAAEAHKTAEARERLRLLYVAMTRAEKWLIVAAGGEIPSEAKTWYQMIEAALDPEAVRRVEQNGLALRRIETGDWQGLPLHSARTGTPPDPPLAAFFATPVASPAPRREIVQPSDLGGAKALSGEAGQDEETARAYGTLVHRYLEHLPAVPPAERSAMAEVLGRGEASWQEAFAEASRLLEIPAFRGLFAPDTLCEVPVSADIGAVRLNGVIDRLVVGETHVLAVDFKTNRTVPNTAAECPDGILRQMGAYSHALAAIYPGRRVDTAILWTRTARLMPLHHDIVMQALMRARYLDDADSAAYLPTPDAPS